MKKLLTLVLCWLIAFSAMAETTLKAKTALSAAGGYITSLNKVDGSFEDGTAGWVASTDTIVQTASTEFQGNYKGTWTATGTGTLDLQWTATASNTYEASAQVNVNGEDDMYVCAYVGTTETGCKLIPALNKIQKVSVVADSVLGSAFYLRLKHTGSDAFIVDVDDGKIEPWTPQAVNLVEQQSINMSVIGSAFTTSGIGVLRFGASNLVKVGSNLFSYDDTTGKFTATKLVGKVDISASFIRTTGSQQIFIIKNGTSPSATNIIGYGANDTLNNVAGGSSFNVGDYFVFYTSIAIDVSSGQSLSITATAISDNVVASYESKEEVITVSQAQNALTDATGEIRYALSVATVVVNSTTASAATSYSSKFLKIEDDGTRTKFIANQETVLSGSLQSANPAGHLAYIYKNGALYKYGSQSPTAGFITETSFEMHLKAGEYFSLVASSSLTSSGDNLKLLVKASSPSTPTLLALPTSQINNYGAEVTSSYTVASGSENVPWISSITNPSSGIARVFVKTDVVNPLALNIQTTPKMSGTGNYNFYAQVSDVTSTYIDVRTGYTSGSTTAFAAYPFFIGLEKRGSDYKAPGVFVGSLAKDYTAYVDSSEVITNATDNFITSCTNADPTVCTFASTKFGTAPYCNAQKTSSADVYVTTTSTTSVTIERADSSSPFSLFCQIK